jgi:hypothetical protein
MQLQSQLRQLVRRRNLIKRICETRMRSLIRGSVLMISPSYVVINMQTRKKRAKEVFENFFDFTSPLGRRPVV